MIRHQILFRALRNEEDPSAGIRPTDPMANLTFKDHVERGGFRVYKPSQFISTTSNLEHAIRWVSEDKSALAVIFCRFLYPSIIIHDLSQGHESLSPLHNSFVDKHGEVLVEPHIAHPFINPSAVRVLSYSDLVETYQSSFRPSFLQDMAPDWQTYFLTSLHRQFRFKCDYCRRPGHNIKYSHYSREYYEHPSAAFAKQPYNTRIADNHWQQLKDRNCTYYRQRGNDDDDFNEQQFEFYLEQYNDRYCHQCNECGHDYDDCNEFSDWLWSENIIQRYYGY